MEIDKATPLFIVGSGRSGTKYLRNILNNSPAVYLTDEIHYFSSLMHNGVRKNLRRICSRSKGYTIDGVVETLLHTEHFSTYWQRDTGITDEMIRSWFRNRELNDRNIYWFLVACNKTSLEQFEGRIAYLGEKGGANVFSMGTLLRWFPEAKFLFIYRDPIAVLNSEVNKPVKPDYPIGKSNPLYPYGLTLSVLVLWFLSSLNAIRYRISFPANVSVIRYETLKQDEAGTVEKICESLNIPFSVTLSDVRKMDSSYGHGERNSAWFAHGWIRLLYALVLKPLERVLDRYALGTRARVQE